MAESPPATPGRIFISYRREETAYPAGWLFDRLAHHFGGGQVFKDVDSIELGDDFVEVITRAVGSCDVLLALIGDQWLTITDEHGRRRLENPEDFVRLEIEAALTRNVRVIPILVDEARMPRADELPDSLARLVRRHALELSPSRFEFDTSRLLKVLDKTLAEEQARPAAKESEVAVLTLWTEHDARSRIRNPSRDLLQRRVSELSLPGEGDNFLVVEHEDRPESYTQTARDGEDSYVVEYRDGDAARHVAASPLSMAEAHAAVCGWAFNLPGWRDRFRWTRVRLGDSRATNGGGTADRGRVRGPVGTWIRSNREAHEDASVELLADDSPRVPATATATATPTAHERPTAAPPVTPKPRWRVSPLPIRLGAAALALVGLGALGIYLASDRDDSGQGPPTPSPTAAPPTTAPARRPALVGDKNLSRPERLLLERIPAFFAGGGTCSRMTEADDTRDIHPEPAAANLQCRYLGGTTVVYSLFQSDDVMGQFFEDRLAGRRLESGQGRFGPDPDWQLNYCGDPHRGTGRAYGKRNTDRPVDPVRAEIGWIREGYAMYAYAFRPSDDFAGLFDWWWKAYGPVDAHRC
jgi:hypothetical protein